MRIAIFGSGGVGGYFGGRLAAAGTDVVFIARGAHLKAMRDTGLRIESPRGDLHVSTVNATDDPGRLGPVDLVLFAVKLYDTESALPMLKTLVGDGTLVVPLQNGVDSVEILQRAVGPQHVVGGTTYVSAVIAEPGLIRHTAMGTLIMGTLDGARSARLEQFSEACRAAGFEGRVSDHILVDIWSKFARLSAFSGMTTVTRCSLGPIRDDPTLTAMMKTALAESIAVARGNGIPLTDTVERDFEAYVQSMPPHARSSMLEDLERGRPLELPWLSGTVVRIGRAVGVATPTHQFITAVLTPHVRGRQS